MRSIPNFLSARPEPESSISDPLAAAEDISKNTTVLRRCKAPWRGELILACTKCQRKLKKHKGTRAFARVKKWFKRRAKSDGEAPEFRVVGIDCLKLCPKAGITVARQQQLCVAGGEVSIIRSEADLEGLYQLVAASELQRKLLRSA